MGLPSVRDWWRAIDRRERQEAREEARVEAERQAAIKKAHAQRRPRCTCPAYGWPHRPRSGNCRHPDPPLETWQPKPGKPRVRFRGLVKRMCQELGLHPVRDRERVAKLDEAIKRIRADSSGASVDVIRYWLRQEGFEPVDSNGKQPTKPTPSPSHPTHPWSGE